MIKVFVFFLFTGIITSNVSGQLDSIPNWFFEDLEAHEGIWTTDNSAYKSEQEAIDAFGMEWKKSELGTSMTGRLYGIKDGKEIGTFWEYREYWDPLEKEVIIVQYGAGGMFGKGILKHLGDGHFETIQTFGNPKGQKWQSKHLNIMTDGKMKSTSFNLNKKGEWVKEREYLWVKQ